MTKVLEWLQPIDTSKFAFVRCIAEVGDYRKAMTFRMQQKGFMEYKRWMGLRGL
jgi:hypothetical protein